MLCALFTALALSTVSAPTFQAQQPGSREDKDGWVVVHLAGNPKEIGTEHGSLLAKEIEDAVETVRIELKNNSGEDWSWYRQTAHKLFWTKLDPEYRDEIQGIADGCKSKGENLDADDILALNGYIEISDYYLPKLRSRARQEPLQSEAPLSCSAFVATGSYTKDGKPVMAHTLWWDYPMGERFYVIFDIKPSNGHRFMMDAVPGFIDSASDWALNDAGIGFCETTISGFVGFDENGVPEFERMRKAIQYSASLDDVDRIFIAGNNGGYANTWLMVDTKTNEIGKLELGLKNVTYVTSKDGYYVGANFPENPKLKAEEAPGYTNQCEDRRQRWIKDMETNKGKIDVEMAKGFMQDTYNDITKRNDGFGGGALCSKGIGGGAVNAKALDTAMASQMQFWARMGCPDGSTIVARPQAEVEGFQGHYHDVKGNPWSVVSAK